MPILRLSASAILLVVIIVIIIIVVIIVGAYAHIRDVYKRQHKPPGSSFL